MFGKNTDVDLNLIELEQALPMLAGLVMELQDCAFPLLKNIVVTSDLNEGMSGANFVVCVGAVPRKAGMERADLLKIHRLIARHDCHGRDCDLGLAIQSPRSR